MAHPLADSRDALDHAKDRTHELDASIAAFLNSKPYAPVIETNAEGTEDTLKIKLVKSFPKQFGRITFDVLGNLRAALDRAGYAVAVAAGSNGKKAHFPFGDSKAYAEGLRRKGATCEQIPKEVFDAMLAFEPYNGGNTLLWALNKLCNSNKHRIVLPFIITTGSDFFIKRAAFTQPILVNLPPLGPMPFWDSTKNEMVIARVAHKSKADYELSYATPIVFSEVEGVAGHEVVGILDAMAGVVEHILVAVEAEARCIGLFS